MGDSPRFKSRLTPLSETTIQCPVAHQRFVREKYRIKALTEDTGASIQVTVFGEPRDLR
jgi:hypothetical protein